MKTLMAVVTAVLILGSGTAFAQQTPPPSGSGGPGGSMPMPGGMGGMHGGGMQGGMMQGGMMQGGMMCPMMSGMMGGGMPMMGMMGQRHDPKMMQMHGEMMKAMGDIMMKYGKQMESAPSR